MAPFDIVHAGLLSGDRAQDAELAQRYAEVGVTWWLEHVYPGRMALRPRSASSSAWGLRAPAREPLREARRHTVHTA